MSTSPTWSAAPVPAGLSRTEVRRRNVAVLIFDGVDVLDFAGPFEVFAAADARAGGQSLHVFTVAEAPSSVRAVHGLKIVPDFTLERCPQPDVLVVPGGIGTRALLSKPALLEWVRTRSRHASVTLSVCTGALVLGKAGLLSGLCVTTHADGVAELSALVPDATIDASRRFHDNPHPAGNGRIVTSAGISAGLDASLYVVSSLLGYDAAEATARYLEYGRFAQPQPD